MTRFGRAAITWTSTVGDERVHELQRPLTESLPAFDRADFTAQSLDRSVIETVSVGSGAHELVGTVRFDNDPQSLLDLIAAGSRNATLTYYPDLSDPDTNYNVLLVEPRSPVALGFDPQSGDFGEATATLRLRKTDEARFGAAAYAGTSVLFRWQAGNTLVGSTFARAGSARRTTKGYGTLSDTTTAVPRLEWVSTLGSSGFRNTPALLVERPSTNRVPYSEDVSAWTFITGTLTSGQADPAGGTDAFLITDSATSAFGGAEVNVTLSSAGPFAYSLFVRQGTTSSTQAILQVYDVTTTGPATRFQGNLSWSSGVPSMTVTFGSTYNTPERFRDGWWRMTGITTTDISTANTNRFRVFPTNGIGDVGDLYTYGAQLE